MKPTSTGAFVVAVLIQLLGVAQAARGDEVPQPLPGQLSSKFKIDRDNPEASVPSANERDANPLEYGYLIQDLLTSAEEAKQKHDYQSVVLYYRAVAKAVPENAKGWSKVCEAYEMVHDTERAIRACKYALERPGVELQDYQRYVHLLLSKAPALRADEGTAIREVLAHLDSQPALQLPAAQLKCDVGVKLNDIALLEACTSSLAKIAPDDRRTIVFQWNLAVQRGEQVEARRLVQRAKTAGVVIANVERMQKITESSGRRWRNMLAVAVAVAVAALFAVATVAWLFHRRRLTAHAVTS